MDKLLIRKYTTNIGVGSIIVPCNCLTIEQNSTSAPTINTKQDSITRLGNNFSIKTVSVPESIVNNFLQNNLDFDDTMVIYRDTDLHKENIRKQIISIDHNFSVLFSMQKIIREILLSYTENNSKIEYSKNIVLTPESKENIFKQIDIDFPRLNISTNSVRCRNKEDFIVFCAKFANYKHPVVENLAYLLLMLSTQASFYYPFNFISNIYNSPDTGIHVTSTMDHPYIDIVDNGTSVDIVFKKIFKAIKISDDEELISKFHTFMLLTIDLIDKSSFYFFNNYKYCECELGMMYWIKEI